LPETIVLEAPEQLVVKKPANAAIYYHPEGFDTTQSKLMGRQAAGESFLKAWAKYANVEKLFCYSAQKVHAEDFHNRAYSNAPEAKPTHWIPSSQINQLAEPGCLFLPGPGLSDAAWQRRHLNPKAYSLCGITHTTASARVMDAIGDLLIAPVQPWDAVICTSQSVKTMVETLLSDYQQYLSQKLGTRIKPVLPQLPVIPLGVDTDAFKPTPEKKAKGVELRNQYGIENDDLAILFMGRLSFHAKAHPYALYRALEMAAQATGEKLHLLMTGWAANDAILKQFEQAAQQVCPSVTVHFIDGRQPEIRTFIWYAADLFTSLSDNIQETFGITPLEAKAAGLPVVVSDWDGYRETVRHNVDGYLVPTVAPAAGNGADLAYRQAFEIDTYDRYIGQACLSTAVDIDFCAEALIQLIQNPTLRKTMSKAGQQDARERFDWRVIIGQYQALFQQLSEIRQNAPNPSLPPNPYATHPLRPDPFYLFEHYPSGVITPESKLSATDQTSTEALMAVTSLSMNTFGQAYYCPMSDVAQLLLALQEKKTLSVTDSFAFFPKQSLSSIYLTLGWMAKMGLLRVF
jgi:starch synthase